MSEHTLSSRIFPHTDHLVDPRCLEVPLDEVCDYTSSASPTGPAGRWASSESSALLPRGQWPHEVSRSSWAFGLGRHVALVRWRRFISPFVFGDPLLVILPGCNLPVGLL